MLGSSRSLRSMSSKLRQRKGFCPDGSDVLEGKGGGAKIFSLPDTGSDGVQLLMPTIFRTSLLLGRAFTK